MFFVGQKLRRQNLRPTACNTYRVWHRTETCPGHIISGIVPFLSCPRDEGDCLTDSSEQIWNNHDASFSGKKDFRESFSIHLCQNMKTPPEQLTATYIAIDRFDFESSARELVRVIHFGDHSSTGDLDREREEATRPKQKRPSSRRRVRLSYDSILGRYR